MALLPSIDSPINTNFNIADLLSKPLSRHRFDTLIGDTTTTTPPLSASAHSAPTAAVASAPTVAAVSDSVPSNPNLDPAPTLTLPTLPIVLDTGVSYSRAPSVSDFLPVGHASYGLFRSPISVVSKALASNPYTLITGEDVSVDPVDLSSPDSTIIIDSDSGSFSGPSFTKVHFDVRQFGTASLTFIFSPNWSLIKVFVTPTQVDWIHWVPLPRLTPTESYFHICGRDYLQAFVLLHLIPIWITLVSALVSALLRSE